MTLFLAYNEHNINDSEIIGFMGNIFEIIALKVFKIIVHGVFKLLSIVQQLSIWVLFLCSTTLAVTKREDIINTAN